MCEWNLCTLTMRREWARTNARHGIQAEAHHGDSENQNARSCDFRGGVGCESSLLVPRRGQTVKVSSLLHVPRPIRSPSRDAQSNSDTLGQVTSARPIPNSRDNGTCYILPWHSTPAPTRAALSHPPRRSRPRSPWRPYAWSRRSRSRSPQRTRCVWVCTPSRALASICPR
jgi:hypothetical protein